jgi:hypothetical protein
MQLQFRNEDICLKVSSKKNPNERTFQRFGGELEDYIFAALK